MQTLLYLVHRIPYPPNKGDKIRSFQLLKHLSKDYKVVLGAFVDDENDWQYKEKLEQYCNEIHLLPLNPTMAKFRSLSGLLAKQALSVPYYHSRKMQSWVNQSIEKYDIKQLIVFSSAMAQFVVHKRYSYMNRIIDFVDVDSDKWRQYSESKNWPSNKIYEREAKYLLQYDKKVTKEFNASLFVSEAEAEHYKNLAPESKNKITFYNNGVDAGYFSNKHIFESPYKSSDRVVVFTGAMDYWANVDAVSWFANQIFPLVQQRFDHAKFYIVGSNPSDEVQKLAIRKGIYVTGRVEDIRPYVLHAEAAVAPLQIARGIQNKVLEAMAMAKIVIATPQAADGIKAKNNEQILVCDKPAEFSDTIIEILTTSKYNHLGIAAEAFVTQNHVWSESIKTINDIIAA